MHTNAQTDPQTVQFQFPNAGDTNNHVSINFPRHNDLKSMQQNTGNWLFLATRKNQVHWHITSAYNLAFYTSHNDFASRIVSGYSSG